MTAFVCWTMAKLLNLMSQRFSMHRTEFSAGCASTRASPWRTSAVPERSGRLATRLLCEAPNELSDHLLPLMTVTRPSVIHTPNGVLYVRRSHNTVGYGERHDSPSRRPV